jgi:hypothetical protein
VGGEEKRSNIMGLEDPGIRCICMLSQCKEKELCRVGRKRTAREAAAEEEDDIYLKKNTYLEAKPLHEHMICHLFQLHSLM